jgi:thioredoxin 1
MRIAMGMLALLALDGATALAEDVPKVPEVPAPGLVTVANFGAGNCIPCRMMAPIRDELRAEFAGRVAVLFIDVHRHYEQIDLFSISLIPTLIFYDKDGNEVKRHMGFMDKAGIKAELARLGVE